MIKTAHLPARAVLSVSGEDRVSFLQGLVSNDVALAGPGRAVWAALLTPQGKWLADFFVFAEGERLLLDVEAAQRDDLARRLSRFRLRAKVAVEAAALQVYAAWNPALPGLSADIHGAGPIQDERGAPPADVGGGGTAWMPGSSPGMTVVAPDPRLPEAGWRAVATELPTNATPSDYDAHRLRLGLPDGSRDMEAEKSVLLEAGFDELSGVSWTKGCYMGQELTARTKYRGLIKRRLVLVSGNGDLPPAGTLVTRDGVDVGTLRSSHGAHGLALLRIDAIGAPLECGGPITASPPPWMAAP